MLVPGLFAITLPVTLNPQKTHSQLAVLGPCWAFCVWGPGKKTKVENEPRAVKVGFRGLGGLYRTVVEELEEEALAYLRWVLGQRPKMPRLTRTHRLKSTRGAGWGA